MNRVIRSEVEYREAMSVLEGLLESSPPPGTSQHEELELLSLLVQDYESRSVRFEPLDPVEAIRFRMEQEGLAQKDLIPYIGSRSRVSEVLSGKRRLTLSMVRRLHRGLGIPLSALVQEPRSEREKAATAREAVAEEEGKALLVSETQATWSAGPRGGGRAKKPSQGG